MDIVLLCLLSVFLYAIYVKIFKKLRQYEREEGLESHKSKSGTVTMGGILFAITPLFFIIYDSKTLPIIITCILYAILGFIDDLLIVVRKNNAGIPALVKLITQIIIAGISFLLYLNVFDTTTLDLYYFKINIKWIYGLFILFILAASTNAFNLVDGVDGLCSGLSLIVNFVFMVISINKQEFTIFYLLLCVFIVLFVFWCFNLPKAFLFMGDTGSLFLGSLYAMTAIYLNSILAYIILVLLFIFETLSVILQVAYFKRTKGKRLFKMAPFHHHLEASGFKEIAVDLLFYAVQIALAIIVLYFKIY